MFNLKATTARSRSAVAPNSDNSNLSQCHRYNTRSSVKLRRGSIPDDFSDELNDSTRFSLSSSGSDLDIKKINRTAMLNRERLDFGDQLLCAPNHDRWRERVKIGGYVLIIAIIGWYVNHIRHQVAQLNRTLEDLRVSVRDILDDRVDILYKIHKMADSVREFRETQENFKVSIQHLIQHEIEKLYTDKTGRTDFALESAGGSIVQVTSGTENYVQPKSSLLGISLCEGVHGPRSIIQTGTSPGECWALKGSSGGVVIRLLGSVRIDAVSMEHISRNISPSGDSSTAPKDFAVWGLKSPGDRGQLLGQFVYDIQGPLVQTFHLPHSAVSIFDYVELRIMSNHGNPEFTCVYRFRVHGKLERK